MFFALYPVICRGEPIGPANIYRNVNQSAVDPCGCRGVDRVSPLQLRGGGGQGRETCGSGGDWVLGWSGFLEMGYFADQVYFQEFNSKKLANLLHEHSPKENSKLNILLGPQNAAKYF